MKTIYRSRNSRSQTRKIIAIIAMGIIVILLLTTSIFSRGFYGMMVVLSGSKDGAGNIASSYSGLFSSRVSLQKENRELKRKLDEAEVVLSDKDILIKENSDLKASIHYKTETGNISARVMSKPPFTPFDVIIIDAGYSQGVKEDDRVMIGQIYIGTVTLVSANSSQITLLSSSSINTEAYVGVDALPVTLNGKGGGNFETSLPQGSVVKEGDLVYAYYLQTPHLIGKVSRIIDDEDNTLMSILLTLPLNLYSISHVEIISP